MLKKYNISKTRSKRQRHSHRLLQLKKSKNKTRTRMYGGVLDKLPDDITTEIVSYLIPEDLMALGLTDKSLSKIVKKFKPIKFKFNYTDDIEDRIFEIVDLLPKTKNILKKIIIFGKHDGSDVILPNLAKILKNIKNIDLQIKYNSFQGTIPDGVTKLYLENVVRDFIPLYPSGLKTLTFGRYYNQPTVLPNGLTTLIFGDDYNQHTPLPNGLTTLTFGRSYNQPVDLPIGLQTLTFGQSYNQNTHLPTGLKTLTFGTMYNQHMVLPTGLKTLTFGIMYNQHTVLPIELKTLTFGQLYNKPTVLPIGLINLTFGAMYNQPTILPTGLLTLTFGKNYNQPTILPKSIQIARFYNGTFDRSIEVWDTIQSLYISNKTVKTIILKSDTNPDREITDIELLDILGSRVNRVN